MNIPDEAIYAAIGVLYVTHSAFQKRQFKKLEKSAEECEEDRGELRNGAIDHMLRTERLESTVKILATPCTTPNCQRNDIIDKATSRQGIKPSFPSPSH